MLACTHYPLIKNQIAAVLSAEPRTDVLDASDVVAAHVQQPTSPKTTCCRFRRASSLPVHHFYVSDFTRSFEESTRIFFEQEVHLEHYPLWE